ncbi:MAG: ComF family protein [Thermoguttaceae bacterium]
MTLIRFGRAGVSWLLRCGRCAMGVVVPRVCYVCDAAIPDDANSVTGQRLCDLCRKQVVVSPTSYCKRCGAECRNTTGVCPACKKRDFHFEQAVILGRYSGALRELVLNAKRDLFGSTAMTLGEWLVDEQRSHFVPFTVDAVIPMPMFWRRRLWRGVNGPDFIAAGVAKQLGCPVWFRVLRRQRATPTQVHRTVAARLVNVRDAFAVRNPALLAGRTVVLVDDVMTTGASCSEAARTLREAGAARVIAAVAARAMIDGHTSDLKTR